MKFLFLITLGLFGTNASADTADVRDLAGKAAVSNHCAQQILNKTTHQCNADSEAREGRTREHECFYSYNLTAKTNGVLNVGFSTGDADEWNYSVYVTDEADVDSCDFTIKSDN